MVIVTYRDKGPDGICGRAVSITTPWHKAWVFDDETAARSFITKHTQVGGRRGVEWGLLTTSEDDGLPMVYDRREKGAIGG